MLVLERLVLGEPAFGNVCFCALVALPSPASSSASNCAFVIVLSPTTATVVRRPTLSPLPPPQPAASRASGEGDEQESGSRELRHRKSVIGAADMAHAAWRASEDSIEQPSAPSNPSSLSVDLALAGRVDGGVDPARSARSSLGAEDERPDGRTPPRKTR